ncbi:transposase, partial [Microbispora sp. H10836]|uniref:transposase n=1 Tax=Microbispora sp. H10836 TaxID=2729106 RepID=UPI001475D0BA
DDEQARAVLVDALVTDAIRLLAGLPSQPLDEQAATAVGLLALVAGQDVEPAEDSDGRDGRWRIAQRTVPDRVISTVDPESRHVHKTRTHRQDGFKAHVAVEPETGLFTAVALRPGSGAAHHEASLAVELLAEETSPVEVFGDAAYSSGSCRHALAEAGHRVVIKPAPLRPAVPGGFTLDDFAIDTAGATVTCPAGHQVPLSAPSGRNQQRKAFFTSQCADCPLRPRCTKAKAGRILTIRPQHDELAAARRQAATDPAWQDDYRRWRPPVERAIAWIVARGNRRLRYIGTIKNNAWLHTRAAALNLRTLINLGLTRTGNVWKLAAARG